MALNSQMIKEFKLVIPRMMKEEETLEEFIGRMVESQDFDIIEAAYILWENRQQEIIFALLACESLEGLKRIYYHEDDLAEKRTNGSRSPFYIAVKNGESSKNLEIVEWFCSIYKRDLHHILDISFLGSPLYYAVTSGFTKIVDILLQHGIDINYCSTVRGHILSQARNSEMLEHLVRRGAITTYVYRDGGTEMDRLAYQWQYSLFKFLFFDAMNMKASTPEIDANLREAMKDRIPVETEDQRFDRIQETRYRVHFSESLVAQLLFELEKKPRHNVVRRVVH